MKESHDYYVNRLTEGYKQQLETMEQSYEDQIRELKTQFATVIEKIKAEATQKATQQIQALQKSLRDSKEAQSRADKSCRELAERVVEIEQDGMLDLTAHRAQLAEQRKKYEERLDKALRPTSLDRDQAHQEVQDEEGRAEICREASFDEVQRAGAAGRSIWEVARIMGLRALRCASVRYGQDVGTGT